MKQGQNTQKLEIKTLISEAKSHLAQIGYRPCTIDRLDAVWKKLAAYSDLQGASALTAQLGREFVWKWYGSVLGEPDTSHNVNRAVHLLLDFQKFSMVFKQSSMTIKGFSEPYHELFEGFLEHLRQEGVADGSLRTWRSRLFRFEYFLKNNGLTRFSQIELHHVNAYIESLAGFSSGTVGGTLKILGRLFDYALENGYHHESFSNALPTVRRIKKYRIPTVFTADEVERILKSVDRNNAIGRRNYAILILVAKLGLRISDARLLRFDSIDWQNRRMSITQKKTGIPLDLPLLDDVGWAIIDYLRNGRPETISEYIFVRHTAPYGPLTDCFRKTVVKAIQKAGIKTPADKPIGMHTFRHSIASSMLANGAKLTEIAQTLGHATPESTQTYISVDVELLRQCALEVTL
ncbi:hypothetical protein AT727_24720 [Desulfitobacterium hafniense]|uniref:Integrase n=1 Tax=Desulfitobacterium hafniense TaxID=49338 RepID=A0A0W1JF47_DESHA|nr:MULTISPECIES: site-specific integrase [Eubacteriales]KTE90269.1 hypothetical protein AT727_24720 [Desulfitobacterium hafniense]